MGFRHGFLGQSVFKWYRRYFMYDILERRQVIGLSYDSSPSRRSLYVGGRFALTSNMEFFTLMAPTMYSRRKVTQPIPADLVPGLSLALYDDIMFVRLSNSDLGVYQLRDPILKQSYSRQWTFPAGVGTGIVNRIGLQANSGTGANGNNRHVAQIVLPEPLEKTDLHQLDVIWEIEVENPGVWEGVILGGSRDGSDLAWRVTINEEQFYALVQQDIVFQLIGSALQEPQMCELGQVMRNLTLSLTGRI